MKSNISILMTAILLSAVLATPIQLAAQDHAHYKLVDLGTFGGPQSYVYAPNSYAQVLNDKGTVAGWADTFIYPDPFSPYCFSDCYVSHAFQSWNGTISDLGALSGGMSSAASWISSDGLIAGWSENGSTDPSFPVPGIPVTHAVLWKDSAITDLKTLKDGYQSVALAVNNRGQVVGAADNGTTDSDAMFSDNYGWVTQTRAFLWQDDVMQDLGTLGGTDAVALLINDRGQIVGASYTSSAPSAYCGANLGASLTTGAFLYEDGEMKNIGSFGGTCTFPADLNNRGEIVGISTLSGDKVQHAFLWKNDVLNNLPNTIGGKNAAAIALNDGGDVVGWASAPGDQDIEHEQIHASLWKNGIMTDLETVDGDLCSNGYSINSRKQVVGVSVPTCDFSTTRAFLWENGSIADLNTLIPDDSSLYLTAPETINDRGEIAGVGVDANGNQHAFLLIPCGHDDDACQNAAGYPESRPVPKITKPASNPNALRRMFRQRSGPVSDIFSPGTSSVRSAIAIKGRPIDSGQVSTTGNRPPDLSESLNEDLGSHFAAAPSCGHYGWPCYMSLYSGCCPGLKCVLQGGSDRGGYKCR